MALSLPLARWRPLRRASAAPHSGRLPKSRKALMEFPNSAIPVVRSINTAPLITASGRLIDGAGLDREFEVFHRIDPVLRRCLPDGKPTNEEIKESFKFLVDEWLVDVALDDPG